MRVLYSREGNTEWGYLLERARKRKGRSEQVFTFYSWRQIASVIRLPLFPGGQNWDSFLALFKHCVHCSSMHYSLFGDITMTVSQISIPSLDVPRRQSRSHSKASIYTWTPPNKSPATSAPGSRKNSGFGPSICIEPALEIQGTSDI